MPAPQDVPALVFSTDENYVPLALDLVDSINDNVRPFRTVRLVCLDIGMSQESISKMSARGVEVKQISAKRLSPDLQTIVAQKPYTLSQFYRPYLPEVVDSETIIYIDSDTWVQDHKLIDACVSGLARWPDRILLTPWCNHYSVSFYEYYRMTVEYQENWFYGYFPKNVAKDLARGATYSSGVFAARRDCRVWALWAAEIARMLPIALALDDRPIHLLEQTALNAVVRFEGLVVPLDPLFNFHCNNGGVHRDPATGKLVTSLVHPQSEIVVAHLANWTELRDKYEAQELTYRPVAMGGAGERGRVGARSQRA